MKFLGLLLLIAVFAWVPCFAQSPIYMGNPSDAPVGYLGSGDDAQKSAAPAVQSQNTTPAHPGTTVLLRITVKSAEAIALKNNPAISVAMLNALASHQVAREARSSLWPSTAADITGVESQINSRITAGGLNNPIIYDRAAVGATVSQLITDFGHTTNLAASARLHAQAEDRNSVATKEQILLAVDQAFYSALQSSAVLKVAQQTVDSRQLLSDQVGALTKSKLKSDIDLSFANVNLAQAKLLQLDAKNNNQAAMANLSDVLGFSSLQNVELIEDTTPSTAPPEGVDQLIAEALDDRPEIQALEFESRSAQKLHAAQRDSELPTISALGAIGEAPVRNDHLASWYGAIGVNVQIPIFNGFLFSAKTHEADLRAQAANQRVLDMRNRISRDVRTGWLEATTAYERVSVNQQLLDQANQALSLAQTRYKLGLSSIVELSQAQLQQTQAEIGSVTASYEYRLALSVLRYQTTGI
ncbi:MAG TPA: TolC family protein [Terriglobales bacterium]